MDAGFCGGLALDRGARPRYATTSSLVRARRAPDADAGDDDDEDASTSALAACLHRGRGHDGDGGKVVVEEEEEDDEGEETTGERRPQARGRKGRAPPDANGCCRDRPAVVGCAREEADSRHRRRWRRCTPTA